MSGTTEPERQTKTWTSTSQFIKQQMKQPSGEIRTQAPPATTTDYVQQPMARGLGMHQEATTSPKVLEIKIVTHNVESMSMDRMRQITTSMRKDKYNVALLQGTRWNLDCGMWSNGYKVYNAPAGKTSTEAHAGESIIIDEP